MKLVDGVRLREKDMPPSGSLEVLMKQMKAYEYFGRISKEGNIHARQELEEAIALDPEHARLYSMLAMTHLLDLFYQTAESPLISFAQASKNIKTALALDNELYGAHIALGYLYWFKNEPDKAIAAAERAIAINPNGADAYAQLAHLFTGIGRAEEAVTLIEKALRLNPIPPAQYLNYLGYAYYLLGRYEDSIEVYEKVLKRSPDNLFSHICLTATYVASGREEEGRQQAEQVLKLNPSFSLDRYEELAHMVKDKAEAERWYSALRKAGLK